jgi:Ca-activated chloride channel homolog
MRFLRPDIAWWMLAALVGVALVRWRLRWRFAASTDLRVLGDRRYRASRLRRLPLALLVAALVFTGIGLMQPVLPFSQAEVTTVGHDIVVVLDVSLSMQKPLGFKIPMFSEEDEDGPAIVDPLPKKPHTTRMLATQEAIRTFIRARRDDRIGLVVFSDNAYVVSPLTSDHESLLTYVDMVDDRILEGEGQTAVGDALALANHLLAMQSKALRHQVVVLFTDGDNNRGVDPIVSLDNSTRAHIRVHMVGVDFDQVSWASPAVRQLVTAVRNDGGLYFNAVSKDELASASSAIDTLEQAMLVNKTYVRDLPLYEWFVVLALLSLLGAMALRAIPYFVDQT